MLESGVNSGSTTQLEPEIINFRGNAHRRPVLTRSWANLAFKSDLKEEQEKTTTSRATAIAFRHEARSPV